MNQHGIDYEKYINKNIKKSLGQFYTPDYLIHYVLSLTLNNADILTNPFLKVLDPSCGAGYFLQEAYDILKEKFEDSIEKLRLKYQDTIYSLYNGETIAGKDYWVKERIPYHILKHCLYGADLDCKALTITKETLIDKGNIDLKLNLVCCNSLIKWEKLNFKQYLTFAEKGSMDEYNSLKEFWGNNFDYIIGNPPFVVLLKSAMDKAYSNYIEENYSTLGYKKNTFYILMERSMEKLKDKGIHSFIVPDRYFSSKSYIKSREMLLKENTLVNVTTFYGKVFNNAVVGIGCYVLKKEKAIFNHSFDLNLNYKKEGSFDNLKVLQRDLVEKKEFAINILTSRMEEKIIAKVLEKRKVLGEYSNIHVGMMIKDKNKEFEKGQTGKQIVIGRDIKEYIISNKERYFLPEEAVVFGGTKSKLKHEKNPKILMRKTGDKIIAAIDFDGVYCEQSVYMIIPIEGSSVYNLLGQLQSKVVNYVYKNSLISNPGRYPYIQHYDGLKLPVNPNLLMDYNFDIIVKDIIALKEGGSAKSLEKEVTLQKELDKLLYKAYDFNEREIDIIENYRKI